MSKDIAIIDLLKRVMWSTNLVGFISMAATFVVLLIAGILLHRIPGLPMLWCNFAFIAFSAGIVVFYTSFFASCSNIKVPIIASRNPSINVFGIVGCGTLLLFVRMLAFMAR